jgi:predicted deacylase
MLVITEKSEQPTAKKEVLVVGRMHPEETVSSYLIEALIKYLLSDGYVPGMLRKTHCFYIVPMLNPDGVILGNSRCSASGRDMNRAWATGMQEDINPEVVALKRFIAEHRRTLKLVLDFHGHLKKKGCFVYGSHSTQQPYFTRELPFVLNSIDPDNFSFRDSGFCLGMNKAGSTRKAIW